MKFKLAPRQDLDIISLFERYTPRLHRYSLVAFIVFVAAIYGFVLLRLESLSSTAPSADAVSSQVQSAQVPNFNKTLVQQIQSLQKDTISVQSNYDQQRSNPFAN